MKQAKQLIERNLKFSEKYIYQDIRRGNLIDGDACMCDNCGKLISNIVHVVRNSDAENFYIGTDCAETLAEAKALYNAPRSDFRIDLYSLSQVKRFVAQYNKTPELAEIDGFRAVIIATEVKEGKVKTKQIDCYLNDLKKFSPNVLQTIANNHKVLS